jgi:hypothetical protein
MVDLHRTLCTNIASSNCVHYKRSSIQNRDVTIVTTWSDIEWVAGKKVNYDLCYFTFVNLQARKIV